MELSFFSRFYSDIMEYIYISFVVCDFFLDIFSFFFFFVNTNSCYSNASINLATLQTEHDDAHIYIYKYSYMYLYMHTSTASKLEEGKKDRNRKFQSFELRNTHTSEFYRKFIGTTKEKEIEKKNVLVLIEQFAVEFLQFRQIKQNETK